MKKLDQYIYESIYKVDKKKQLDIILKNNPANDEEYSYHTWIRTIDDIKTFEEAIQDENPNKEDLTPDFRKKDIEKALKTNRIIIYSSKEIKPGIFVTPSKIEAQNYAGNNKVYSMEVMLSDIAWIDPLQGQYAKNMIV